MRRGMMRVFLGLLLFFCRKTTGEAPKRNPYKVLGVSRHADQKDIKKSYRSMSLKYHPDKNADEGASAKFQEIQSAYEILSDPKKKREYDTYGSTSTKRNTRNSPFHRRYEAYYSQKDFSDSISIKLTDDNWDLLTRSNQAIQPHLGGSTYASGAGGDSSFFRSVMLDKSSVLLVYVFGQYCRQCTTVTPVWESAVNVVRDVMLTAKVHSDYENGIVRRLGIRHIPAIVAVRTDDNGSIEQSYFRGTIDKASIVKFARQQLQKRAPVQLLSNNAGLITFQKNWKRFNSARGEKIRIVILARSKTPTLAYMYAANLFQHHAVFGHVCYRCMGTNVEAEVAQILNSPHVTQEVLKSIQTSREGVLVYRDGPQSEFFLEELPSSKDKDKLVSFLSRVIMPRIPEVTKENFFELCYGGL